MKTTFFLRSVLIVLCHIMVFSMPIQAQDICAEGECSEEIFSVKLDGSLMVDTLSPPDNKRTEQYKAAYYKIKQIKEQEVLKPGWIAKYTTNQLTGKTCARLNQLESYMANEYLQNPDFAKFINSVEPDVEAFKENAFQSSRRAINMVMRMKDKCPSDVKTINKGNGPSSEDTPKAFQELGVDLGYFDRDGNVLKQMKSLSGDQESVNKQPKLSKKKRIELLKTKLAELELGAPIQSKIEAIKTSLETTESEISQINELTNTIKTQITQLETTHKELSSKLEQASTKLRTLEKFNPRIPREELSTKISGLVEQENALKIKIEKLQEQNVQLQSTYESLIAKRDQSSTSIQAQTTRINERSSKLTDLQQRKADMELKLEDKPRKIIDELELMFEELSNETQEFGQLVEVEDQKRNEIVTQVESLSQDRSSLQESVSGIEREAQQTGTEGNTLQAETDLAETEVEAIKQEEEELDKMANQLDQLISARDLEKKLKKYDDELQALYGNINDLDKTQEKVKKKSEELYTSNLELRAKLFDLTDSQKKLKEGKRGIPPTNKTLGELDDLLNTTAVLDSTVADLTNKRTVFQESLQGVDRSVLSAKESYNEQVSNLEKMHGELVNLAEEKATLNNALNQGTESVESLSSKVEAISNDFEIFELKSNEFDLKEVEQKIVAVENDQKAAEKELEELEEASKSADGIKSQIESKIIEIDEQIETDTKNAEQLQADQDSLREEFGQEIQLEPVQIEDWAQKFEIERPYWEAEAQEEDELIEGMKGRYFEVQLKDAEKSIKLLFGPGEYYKEPADFRRNYGATIGAFVREALYSLKKSDKKRVKVFIQGSADISGNETFSGKMDTRFLFGDLSMLPLNEEDKERFLNELVEMQVSETDFKNIDLPNLRARYLKEMITAYSKKFEPVILEGVVKNTKDIKERNATIYIYFSDELLSEYED